MCIGIFSTEAGAARAVDWSLIAERGIDAASVLNYSLADYVNLLSAFF
jgi:hypothetical protein